MGVSKELIEWYLAFCQRRHWLLTSQAGFRLVTTVRTDTLDAVAYTDDDDDSHDTFVRF